MYLFFPGFGDSKNWIRAAAVTCVNTWGDLCGYKEFFDGEMIGDALKAGSPTLRTELWAWLADKLNKGINFIFTIHPLFYSNTSFDLLFH